MTCDTGTVLCRKIVYTVVQSWNMCDYYWQLSYFLAWRMEFTSNKTLLTSFLALFYTLLGQVEIIN